jgi:organic hydroperoxide reductase OsmC/OhrA
MSTDMPTELGGSGDQVTPGWLFRAGLASCCATCIAMGAAAAGIELAMLEVSASSRSDTRGLLGMADDSGEPVGAGPRDVQLVVRISAFGVSAERLRILVEDCNRCSPIAAAVRDAVPLALQIEVGTA